MKPARDSARLAATTSTPFVPSEISRQRRTLGGGDDATFLRLLYFLDRLVVTGYLVVPRRQRLVFEILGVAH
jgi:hypothetical protein